MPTDRFGNSHARNLPYARGKILATTEDDFRKLQRAWSLIRERGPDAVFIFTGLEHSLPISSDELRFADDEIAPALYFEQLRSLALAHLGGSADRDDVAVFNRMTGATLATHLTLEEPPIVPYEAAAAMAMLLLQNHGMLMVHFVGIPPRTADLLIKFVPPETLQRFGGAGRYARAIDDSLSHLGALLREPASITGLLLGTGQSHQAVDVAFDSARETL